MQAIYDAIRHRIEWAALVAANGSAWTISFVTENFSIAGVVAVCSVAVPAVGGAVVYLIKQVGPVWLGYLADRDKLRSASLAGQMNALTLQLSMSNDRADLETRIAKGNADRADVLKQTLKLMGDQMVTIRTMLEAANADRSKMAEDNAKLQATADESLNRANAANEKLHTLLNDQNAVKLQHDLDKMEHAAEVKKLNAEITELRAKHDQVIGVVAETKEAVAGNADKLDRMIAKDSIPP